MQFRSDILQKSPLSRSKINFLKLDVDRRNPPPKVFTDVCLSRYWVSIQFKQARVDEWKANIDKLFPTGLGAIKSWHQGFRQCKFIHMWGKLVTQFHEDEQILKRIKIAIGKLLNRMLWLPLVQGKLWNTRVRATYTHKGDRSLTGPAVLLHPRVNEDRIRWERAHREELRQEEEESSD
jgi:hypothetical protein